MPSRRGDSELVDVRRVLSAEQYQSAAASSGDGSAFIEAPRTLEAVAGVDESVEEALRWADEVMGR